MSEATTKNKTPDVSVYVAIIGILLLFTGFLLNRVVSNIGFLCIGIYSLYHIRQVRWLWSDVWMITFIGLGVLPLVSDLWLEGPGFLRFRGVMKLLLILFPVFLFALKPKELWIRYIMAAFMGAMLISTVYSLLHYFSDFEHMAATYKISKVMPVLSKGDHIRIGWASIISCVLAMYLFESNSAKIIKIPIILYIVLQIAFVHLLGSKTSLIVLYSSILILGIFTFNKNQWWLIIFFPLLMLLPYIAYKTIPSVEQRFNFVKYDYEHYSRGEYKEGLSDAVRYFSLMAGKDIITDHMFLGTGFSRLQSKTNEWYEKNVPEMGRENYFLPSSQILIYWASGGILGLIIFLAHIIVPFLKPELRKSKWFMIFFIPAVITFLFETHLEGQLPLFLYGFFASLFWYIAVKEKSSYQHNFC